MLRHLPNRHTVAHFTKVKQQLHPLDSDGKQFDRNG